jgi:hypothetical protein
VGERGHDDGQQRNGNELANSHRFPPSRLSHALAALLKLYFPVFLASREKWRTAVFLL